MKRLGHTLNCLLKDGNIKKSDFAAKCGLSPPAITKVLQGDSYSNEMAGKIISGIDDSGQRAALLVSHLEDMREATGIDSCLVEISEVEHRPDTFKVPYHLKPIFIVLARECQHDPDLEASLRYLASRFGDFRSQQLHVAESEANDS